jgi:hypothetical protein
MRMRYDEFLRQLGKAGLTVREFAELLSMNRNSVTNCAQKGEAPAHLGVIAALMAEMAENGLDFRTVVAKLALSPKKPRGGGLKGHFGGSPQTPLQFEKDETT